MRGWLALSFAALLAAALLVGLYCAGIHQDPPQRPPSADVTRPLPSTAAHEHGYVDPPQRP